MNVLLAANKLMQRRCTHKDAAVVRRENNVAIPVRLGMNCGLKPAPQLCQIHPIACILNPGQEISTAPGHRSSSVIYVLQPIFKSLPVSE